MRANAFYGLGLMGVMLAAVGCTEQPAEPLGVVQQPLLAEYGPLANGNYGFYNAYCTPGNNDGNLVIFAGGNTTLPGNYRYILRVIERDLQRCAIGVFYHNTPKLVDCAAAGPPSGGLDGAIYQTVLDARSTGTPSSYQCSGVLKPVGPYFVGENYLEKAISDALNTLGMVNYLNGTDPDWSKLTLAGHSHGGKMSQYIATTRHQVYGLATIEGSTNKMAINPTNDFLPWVYGPQQTPANTQRVFQHVNSQGPLLGAGAWPPQWGVPLTNLLVATSNRPNCPANAHSCLAYDGNTPFVNEYPEFAPEWALLTDFDTPMPSCTPGVLSVLSIQVTPEGLPRGGPNAPKFQIVGTTVDECGTPLPGINFTCDPVVGHPPSFNPLCNSPGNNVSNTGTTGGANGAICPWVSEDVELPVSYTVNCQAGALEASANYIITQ